MCSLTVIGLIADAETCITSQAENASTEYSSRASRSPKLYLSNSQVITFSVFSSVPGFVTVALPNPQSPHFSSLNKPTGRVLLDPTVPPLGFKIKLDED